MQKLIYPYLPEGMRNPETFQWMVNNPEYRVQLEQALNKQVRCSTPTSVLGAPLVLLQPAIVVVLVSRLLVPGILGSSVVLRVSQIVEQQM